MTMNPLPPQAYTRETMLKAYHWLQSQNESIKEMASNPDILVSLYLKAKLNGDGALERPSIQNFKNELKNLAGMMGEFENEAPAPLVPPYQPQSPPPPQQHQPVYQQPPPQQVASAPSPKTAVRPASLDSADPLWEMIREVKAECHLSSDQEALRLLVSIGLKKFKSFLEK